MKQLLVFTDLDGTLFDHRSYSHAPAEAALACLRRHGIPLVFNSSKTLAEIASLRADLDNAHPYAAENGGLVCVPAGYFPGFWPGEHVEFMGTPRDALLDCLERLRRRWGYAFRGFSDYSDAELALETGLSQAQAALARRRLASEPIKWLDGSEALKRFRAELEALGLRLSPGGRFLHVTGAQDKASAMGWLVDRYRRAWPGVEWVTVALGDSANDRSMLEAADIPVVIPPDTGPVLRLAPTIRALYAPEKGPAGWQWAIERVLGRLA